MGPATKDLVAFVFTSSSGRRHAAMSVRWIFGKGFRARGSLLCGPDGLEGVADFLGLRDKLPVDCKKCLVKLRRRVRELMRIAGLEAKEAS